MRNREIGKQHFLTELQFLSKMRGGCIVFDGQQSIYGKPFIVFIIKLMPSAFFNDLNYNKCYLICYKVKYMVMLNKHNELVLFK